MVDGSSSEPIEQPIPQRRRTLRDSTVDGRSSQPIRQPERVTRRTLRDSTIDGNSSEPIQQPDRQTSRSLSDSTVDGSPSVPIELPEPQDSKMQRQWVRTRSVLKQHWEDNGGMTNPDLARTKKKGDCRSQEDWDALCDLWDTENHHRRCAQMKVNRSKQVTRSRGGSKSIANHKYEMMNPETQALPSPFKVYEALHKKSRNGEWRSHEDFIQYEKILQHKNDVVEKLISENTIITPELERELEE